MKSDIILSGVGGLGFTSFRPNLKLSRMNVRKGN
jgi:hypothetical protein